jgi:hypothetical protein
VKAQLQPLVLPNARNAHGTNRIRIENGKHMIEPVAQDALILGENPAVTHTAQPAPGELREVDVLKFTGEHALEALRSAPAIGFVRLQGARSPATRGGIDG